MHAGFVQSYRSAQNKNPPVYELYTLKAGFLFAKTPRKAQRTGNGSTRMATML